MTDLTRTEKNLGFLFYKQTYRDAIDVVLSLSGQFPGEFNLFAFLLTSEEFPLNELELELKKRGIQVIKVPIGNRLGYKELMAVKGLLKEHKIQILHTHRAEADFIGFLLRRFIPKLEWVNSVPDPQRLKELKPFRRWMYRRLLKSNHWTVFWSAAHQKQWKNLVAKSKSYVIYPGVVDQKISDLNSESESLRFVFCGPLEPGWGAEDALKAFSLVRANRKNVFLKIYGEGSLKAQLKLEIEALKLESCIQIQPVPHQVSTLFDENSIYLQPYQRVGPSLVLLEAMNQAIPIIVTDVGGVSEYVSHKAHGLLVPVNDPYRISLAMQSLIQDPEARESLGQQAKMQFQNKFTLGHMVESYRLLYRML